MKECTIYGLIDKRQPDDVRYIGQTRMTLKERLYYHEYHAYRSKNNKYGKWLINNKNHIDIITIKENATWNIDEPNIIKSYMNKKHDLVNMSLGPGMTGRNFTKEHREKLRDHRIGKVTSDNTKQKLSNALKGRKRPQCDIIKIKNTYSDLKIREKNAIANGAKPFNVFKDGYFIGEWTNASQCARDLSVPNSTLYTGLHKGKAVGYVFEFLHLEMEK